MTQLKQHGSTDILIKITETVAKKEDKDQLDLPSLHDYVDPEALSHILQSSGDEMVIEFSYLDYCVTVEGSGVVSISDKAESPSPSHRLN